MTRCPPEEHLDRLLREELAEADRQAVEAHVETCPRCQARLDAGLVAD